MFKVNNEVIYVGSSKNLYFRMANHRYCINKGSNNGSEIDFYQFLQSNQFTVEFQLSDNYKELEQKLIEKHNPKYNAARAYTGLGTRKGRKAEYDKEWQQKYHKEFIDYKRCYNNQMCNYKGQDITLNALTQRFFKEGFSNPTTEAKKYLIKEV